MPQNSEYYSRQKASETTEAKKQKAAFLTKNICVHSDKEPVITRSVQ